MSGKPGKIIYFILTALILGVLTRPEFISASSHKDVTLIFTGETHAMVYPCNCPKERDGGLARRMALIKQVRRRNPNTILVDSGGFFASGMLDEYSINNELDKQRTLLNLKAMEKMRYDAVAVGEDELNYGLEFITDYAKGSNIAFLSCNIVSENDGAYIFRPYAIKESAGNRFAIIGVSPIVAMNKVVGYKIMDPKYSVQAAIKDIKDSQKADIIILLSHLGEADDLELLKEVPGIDILVQGHNIGKGEPSLQVGSTLMVRPTWQGRRLGVADLAIADNKVRDYKVNLTRLSKDIKDDPDIVSELPECFSGVNCKKEGHLGNCQNPGQKSANCVYTKMPIVNLSIVMPKKCIACNTEIGVAFLKGHFPGLKVSYIYYPSGRADKIIKDYGIKGLPAYILGKEADKEDAFNLLNMHNNSDKINDSYLLKPNFIGLSYALGRERTPGSLDLFISLYDKYAPEILNVSEEFKPKVHFLAIEQNDWFDATKGRLEIEDYLRAVCIEKYYPGQFYGYIKCRAGNIKSSWWDDCAYGVDNVLIKTCAKGEEGKELLRKNISLNKEFQIMFGPTYLSNNQEIFGSKGVPSKEDLKKMLQ